MSEIDQLNQAKQVVIQSPQSFSQVIQIILPIANSTNDLKLQQWCSQFFEEFTSPESKIISNFQKQEVSSPLLPTLIHLSKINDVYVFKNVILTLTNLYDLIFDLVAKTSNQVIWNDVDELKKFIILQWASTYPLTPSGNREEDERKSIGVKLAILKLITKIIIVQTPNNQSKDPRRPNSSGGGSNTNEISVGNISDNHSVINKNVLDAEAQGLLDLLINYLQDESLLIPQKMIAIMNSLVIILQKRYQLYQGKILQSLVNLKTDTKLQLELDSNLKFRLSKRFVDRYQKNTLNYLMKSNMLPQSNPLFSKAQKIISSINIKMDEQKKKGILTNLEPDGNSRNKRIKLEAPPPPPPGIPQQTPPALTITDNSYASLYKLIDSSNELSQFDVSQIPQQTLSNLAIAVLANLDVNKLISSLSVVSTRYADVMNKTPPPPPTTSTTTSTSQSTIAKNEAMENLQDDEDNNEILGEQELELDNTYVLPPPTKLSLDDKKAHLRLIIENFFKMANYKKQTDDDDNETENEGESLRINKIAITSWSKSSWVILLTRLATRGISPSGSTDEETEDSELSDLIRDSIFKYFLDDIHDRIDIIIQWLNEEWYTEFTKNFDPNSETTTKTPTYLKWTEKTLDTLIPFLEKSHRKLFIRLLSDLPFLNEELVKKLKSLCIDPERSSLGFQALQFLIMFKPPVKSHCLDILKDLYENNEDLKSNSLSLLKKYLPDEFGDKEE